LEYLTLSLLAAALQGWPDLASLASSTYSHHSQQNYHSSIENSPKLTFFVYGTNICHHHQRYPPMARNATANALPPVSSTQELINNSRLSIKSSPHPPYLHHLAIQIQHNLQFQHSWSTLTVHTHSPQTFLPLPRPIISGLPPKRAYIHPDEQAAVIKAEHDTGRKIEQISEREWVLPSHIKEKWSLSSFAKVFAAIGVVPPGESGQDEEDEDDEKPVGERWQGENRQKRLLLATLDEDSTVTYYIMHDGIVKPRQN
jgi:tRNA-splicing endonuclease subunit Sen15